MAVDAQERQPLAMDHANVDRELQAATDFARSLDPADFKRGDWFVRLLSQLLDTYDRNARAGYFQAKYRGLPDDDVADALVRTAVRYAAITGGATGAAATVGQVAAPATAGVGLAVVVGAIGSEMATLAWIQMRLVFDLATIYHQPLDVDDPEDVITVFGYALGAAPVEGLGVVAKQAAAQGTRTAVRRVITKGTLQAIQDAGRLIGMKILQRSIIKYTVPVASAAVGASYNYVTTNRIGAIAKAHMRNRGRAASELRAVVGSGSATAGLALPAAMLVMARADGQLRPVEKELYRALLSNVEEDEGTADAFERLLRDRYALLEALAESDSAELRTSVVEGLALMAAYDGEASPEEVTFIQEVAAHLGVAVDLDDLARQATGYRVAADEGVVRRAGAAALKTARAMGGGIRSRLQRGESAEKDVSDPS